MENEVIGIDIDTLLVLQMLSYCCHMIGIEYLHRMSKNVKNDMKRKARSKYKFKF